MKLNPDNDFLIWTVLDVRRVPDGALMATYDVDGTGQDEDTWLMRAAFRAGYHRPAYTFHWRTERRPNEPDCTQQRSL